MTFLPSGVHTTILHAQDKLTALSDPEILEKRAEKFKFLSPRQT